LPTAAQATICYTGDISDPRKTKYTLDYYLEMADALVGHGLHTLCIKDMVRETDTRNKSHLMI